MLLDTHIELLHTCRNNEYLTRMSRIERLTWPRGCCE